MPHILDMKCDEDVRKAGRVRLQGQFAALTKSGRPSSPTLVVTTKQLIYYEAC